MKRLLSQQKTGVVFLGLMGLLFVASSFTFGPLDDVQLVGSDPQTKEQRVKVIVNVDGKKTKVDTVFNLPDERMINEKVDSILSNLDHEGVIQHKGKRMRFHTEGMNGNPVEDQFDVTVQCGDSGAFGKGRKVICLKEFEKDMMDREDNDELMPPPPPPMPPKDFMMRHRFAVDPFAFDTKDESIISYEKKDIGNGLEKITIIRKKHDDHNMDRDIRVQEGDSSNSLIKKKEDERKALKKLKDEAEAKKENKQ